MTQNDQFRWHPDARLFAGNLPVERPNSRSAGFQAISSEDLSQVVHLLGCAVVAGDPFCVSSHPLPAGCSAECGDFLTLTGGSSGVPKVIRRSQASWIASFEVNQRLFRFARGQATAVLGLLSHSLALYGVLEALHLGMHAHVLAGQSAAGQRTALRQHRIETLYATPTQLRLLATGQTITPLPDVTRILCGGGLLDLATQNAAQQLCPNAVLHQFYGAAETSFITLTDAQTPQGSVGKAYPNVDLKITEGEVWVRSPYLFKNYATQAPPPLQDANGFVSIGEMGSLDPQGNLWLHGRKSRMVKVADQSVYPEQIEQHIMATTNIPACVVVPVPDQTRGHRMLAVLQALENPEIAAKVKAFCQDAFGPLLAPRRVLFHPDLPQLPSGKPDIQAITRWAEEQT